MKAPQDFETRFAEVFQPIFLWGVAVFEMLLVIYAIYMEFFTGTGPSLLTTVLPLSIAIAIAWAVIAVLITLAIVSLRSRKSLKSTDPVGNESDNA